MCKFLLILNVICAILGFLMENYIIAMFNTFVAGLLLSIVDN